MRITIRDRTEIAVYIYKTLVERCYKDFKTRAEAFLYSVYNRWYNETIHPNMANPLFKLLPHHTQVSISNNNKTISFRLPSPERIGGHDRVEYIQQKDLFYDPTVSSSYWSAKAISCTLTSEEETIKTKLETEILEKTLEINKHITVLQDHLAKLNTYKQMATLAPDIFLMLPPDIKVRVDNEKRIQQERRATKRKTIKELDIANEALSLISRQVCIEQLVKKSDDESSG